MGVQTVMVTGDAAPTAAAIAAQIGLGGQVCPPGAIPDRVRAADFSVYAGVFPVEKFHLVKAFQRAGHTVGMCGDGANDAPALRQARMGIGRRAFQRILTYTLNALVKKLEFVLFLAAGLIMTGHAILTPMRSA